jgi:tetratricopeptide (TPR) repeat protein
MIDPWDEDEIFERLTEIDLSGFTAEEKIDAHRREADAAPPDSPAHASFSTALADHLQMGGRHDEARAVLTGILDHPARTAIHQRAALADLELEAGETQRAEELLRELLDLSRAGALEDSDHSFVGESLEEHARLREAHRWFTIPLRDLDPSDIETLDIGCVHGRYRVRRELGLPVDLYDKASEEIKAWAAQARD